MSYSNILLRLTEKLNFHEYVAKQSPQNNFSKFCFQTSTMESLI